MVFLLIGAMCWFIGRQTSGETSESEVTIIRQLTDGFVALPTWLYWLCGKPHSDNLPEQVIPARALMAQLTGILFLVYGYFDYTKRPAESTNPEAFVLIPLLGIGLGYFLKRIMPFHP